MVPGSLLIALEGCHDVNNMNFDDIIIENSYDDADSDAVLNKVPKYLFLEIEFVIRLSDTVIL